MKTRVKCAHIQSTASNRTKCYDIYNEKINMFDEDKVLHNFFGWPQWGTYNTWILPNEALLHLQETEN